MIKILKFSEVSPEDVFGRAESTVNVEDIVTDIIYNVRKRGDEALYEYCEKFDKAKLSSLLVSEGEIEEAFASVEPRFIEILEKAAANIRKFHEKQVRNSFIINDEDGIVIGQKVIPVDRAGLYVPGGTAAYPSTVLMRGKAPPRGSRPQASSRADGIRYPPCQPHPFQGCRAFREAAEVLRRAHQAL